MDTISKDKIIENLKQVYDPEIAINIYDLGLIYDIEIRDTEVTVTHTLTSAFCPEADVIVSDIRGAVYGVGGVTNVEVITTFDPPFSMDKVPEETRMLMGW